MGRAVVFGLSHAAALALGIAAGIYALPIMIAPPSPDTAELERLAARARFTAVIRPELAGHDWIHWGEGTLSIGRDGVSLAGRIGPGPDYKLYLSPEMVEDEDAFRRVKARSARVGNVETFTNFVVPMPASIDPSQYVAVVVWCESFSRFITAARYR